MKRNLLIAILFIFGSFSVAEVNGQFIDHTFTYQGELVDAGKPASDNYDITIQGYDSLAGGISAGSLSTHTAVTVENGLFTLDKVDLGAATFDGKEIWLEVNVRKTSDGGSYTALAPRQSLKAVPYAETLTNGNATNGQVLTFDGSQWAPATNPVSPWNVVNSEINYMNNVGIGIANPQTSLHVKSTNADIAMFEGGDNMFVWFFENGRPRGYVGSYLTPGGGILDEDFEIGTTQGSTGNMHIVSGNNEPRITVTADGKVGINSVDPWADLFIDATDDGDVFRIRVNEVTKLYVADNGGMGVGGWTTPPEDGLRVTGETELKNNLTLDGSLAIAGDITSADSGTANMKPYIYGFSNSDASVLPTKSSAGFSISREAIGKYKVSFDDLSINNNYIAIVTLNSSIAQFSTVTTNYDYFYVYVWNHDGTSADHAFQFVVYRK